MPAAAQILSADWHRVADLRPRLQAGLRIERQRVRGQRWQVLLDEATGRSARLNPAAYAIAARLDGQRSLGQLWQQLEAHTPPDQDPPSQDELIQTVRQLHQHHLLAFDQQADFGALTAPSPALGAVAPALNHEHPAAGQSPWWSKLWSWRLPLIDPSRWLARCGPLARALFSRTALGLWLAAMLLMLIGLLMQGPRLWSEALTWLDSPRLLWVAALLYPVMKAIHEASHALAVRRWEGRVTEAGFTLMMLMPVPYVDASAASAFPRATQRVVVSAAGIMAELALAALGFGLWCLTDEGWLHDLGLVMWFLGAVSTVLFNANPLQRLDGYHVMADICQLPNLAPRSRQWWQERWQHWLSSSPRAVDGPAQRMAVAPGERRWLIAYAPLSWLYMLGLGWVIALSLGRLSTALGVAVGLAWALAWLVWPALRWWRQGWFTVLTAAGGDGPATSAGLRRLMGVPAVLLAVLALPWPDATLVRGVVWPPEQALVRTATDGFVDAVHVSDGAVVEAGQLLITLRNPRLLADQTQREAQLARAEQDQFSTMGHDPARAAQAAAEVARLQADVVRVAEQVAALSVRAGRSGRVVLPHLADLPGRHVGRGELLGHVLTAEPASIKVAVRENDPLLAARHDTASGHVSVRLASQGLAHSLTARIWRDAQGAATVLPTAALSTVMGGDIVTAPDDPEHRRAQRPVVLMDIRLAANQALPPLRPGERAWVRIDRGWSPPIMQVARWAMHRTAEVFHPSR